jgi:hypothetical protein
MGYGECEGRTLTADGAEPALCLAPPAGLLPGLLSRIDPDFARRVGSRCVRAGRRRALGRTSSSASLRRLGSAKLAAALLAAHDLAPRTKFDHADRTLLADDEVAAREEDDVPGRDEADDALVGRIGRLEEVLGLRGLGRVRSRRGLGGWRRRRRQAKDLLELEGVVADLGRGNRSKLATGASQRALSKKEGGRTSASRRTTFAVQ